MADPDFQKGDRLIVVSLPPAPSAIKLAKPGFKIGDTVEVLAAVAGQVKVERAGRFYRPTYFRRA